MAVIGACQEDENAVNMTYSSQSKLVGGLSSSVELPGGFTFTVDEPETMPGGTNAGPNPLDLVCGAFGTCQEITYKLYATVMEIPLKSVSCSVKAPCDLRGLVGLDDGAVSLKCVNAVVTIDSEASDEQLETLKQAVDAHCPLLTTLSKSTNVSTAIVKVDSGAEAAGGVPAEGVMAVIGAGKEDPTALTFEYSSESKLSGGGLDTKLVMPLGHEMVIDEPASMPGGNNLGPDPLHLFCASFGTCQEITYKLYATVLGIPLASVSANVKAPIDLRGLLGLTDASTVGLNEVTAEITLDSTASEEQLQQLKAAVDAHCPMVDTLKSEIPVTVEMKRA
jgi:uncharacterized OsmC-like protein